MLFPREIAYKHLTSPKRRRKIIAVREKTDNKDCLTTTHKRFVYILDRTLSAEEALPKPEFYITKYQDAKTKTEKFAFKVKGMLCVPKNGEKYLVHYSHSLKVNIAWKDKVPTCQN